MIKAEGLGEIQSGDCVALHTGQGNTWGNAHYPTMTSEQRAAARAIFAQGEPGFGISACEYFASRDIALTDGRHLGKRCAASVSKATARRFPATPR